LTPVEIALLNTIGDRLKAANGAQSISIDWLSGAKTFRARALGRIRGDRRDPALVGQAPHLGDAVAGLLKEGRG
jgi:hypothetical protein